MRRLYIYIVSPTDKLQGFLSQTLVMKPNVGKRDHIIKYQMVFLFTSSLLLDVAAMSTNNRILLGTVVAGSALATSLYGDYNFSEFDLALLTSAVLILTIPRPSEPAAAVKSCSAPGYTDDPLLGCYRIIEIGLGTHADAAKLCVSDGGRLLLINSEEELQAVLKILNEMSLMLGFIQGRRTSESAPWTDDSGNALPYLTPVIYATGDRLGVVKGVTSMYAVPETRPIGNSAALCEL